MTVVELEGSKLLMNLQIDTDIVILYDFFCLYRHNFWLAIMIYIMLFLFYLFHRDIHLYWLLSFIVLNFNKQHVAHAYPYSATKIRMG